MIGIADFASVESLLTMLRVAVGLATFRDADSETNQFDQGGLDRRCSFLVRADR